MTLHCRGEMASQTDTIESERSIVIVGKIGAGKATIANIILGKKSFNVGGHGINGLTRPPRATTTTESASVNIKLIDTNGPLGVTPIERIFAPSKMNDQVNLILFVVRHGTFTSEDIEPFEYFIRHVNTPDASKCSALVLTNCEQISVSGREAAIEDFRKSDNTRDIARFMGKGILAVGFPNLDDTDEDFISLFEKRMKIDEQKLSQLVSSSREVIIDIFASEKIRRNIIIIGKVGAGKATIANQILHKQAFGISDGLFGITRSASSRSCTLGENTINNMSIRIKLVDTDGLDRDSGDIMKSLEEEMSRNVNLVLFVARNGRFTTEDKKPLEYFLENANKECRLSKISAFILTNCEQKNELSRKAIIEDFKKSDFTKHIASLMGKDILAVGFPKLEDIDEDFVGAFEKRMKIDQQKLYELVEISSETISLTDIFKQRQQLHDHCSIL